MLKAFKYRILPNAAQSELINKHIGCTRFVYNLALETKTTAYAGNRVSLSCFDLMKQLTDLKKECPWLKEVNAQSLQVPIRNLDNAFTRFFKGQSDFPVFKKKGSGGSFNIPQEVEIKEGKLSIPKFRDGIEIVIHRPIAGAIRQATVSRTPTGKYFASILCETGEIQPDKRKIKENTTVGIDLGLKTFLVASNGETFDNPRFLRKMESRLKFTQRKYSKHKGKRTKHKLAILHEKVANQRKDFLHKASTHLVKNHDTIAIEDLNIAGMLQNHCLAKSISDAGWYSFTTMLEYKADWYGKNVIRIGKFQPSSKTCNHCGTINKELKLSDRTWDCACGAVLDRDMNAAVNIKNFALKNHLSVDRRLKNRGKLPTLVGALSHETH